MVMSCYTKNIHVSSIVAEFVQVLEKEQYTTILRTLLLHALRTRLLWPAAGFGLGRLLTFDVAGLRDLFAPRLLRLCGGNRSVAIFLAPVKILRKREHYYSIFHIVHEIPS